MIVMQTTSTILPPAFMAHPLLWRAFMVVHLRLIQSQSFPWAHRSRIRPHRGGTPVPPHRRILRPDSFGSIECQTPDAWEAKREARSSRASAGETSVLVDEAPRSRRFRYTPHRSTTPHISLRWSRSCKASPRASAGFAPRLTSGPFARIRFRPRPA